MCQADSIADHFIATAQEEHLRLDKLLALHYPQYSRTYFQYLIDQSCVLVNSKPVKKRERILEGDEIEVCFLLIPEIALQPENIPLDILYEDQTIIAVNKPFGMVVHPAPGHSKGTFVNALLHHCKTLDSQDPLRPGIVHRLDKDTTGVLIAAKNSFAHAHLVHLFSERKIQKKYIAICIGSPKEGIIDLPIARHPVHRQRMTVCPIKGKEAKTKMRILSKNSLFSCVEIDLLTGRTHQIRVHMQHLGTPILGDPLYGFLNMNKKLNICRQFLHAFSIQFTHPADKTPLEIIAPLPSDFLSFLKENSLLPEALHWISVNPL